MTTSVALDLILKSPGVSDYCVYGDTGREVTKQAEGEERRGGEEAAVELATGNAPICF